MEIITGYFDNSQQAINAAEELRQHGFKGEISIIGQHNEEAFLEAENVENHSDNIIRITNFGVAGGIIGGAIGLVSLTLPGVGPLIAAGPIIGLIGGSLGGELVGTLTRWGVSEKEGEEFKRIIKSGKSIILLKSDENEEQLVKNVLEDNGVQNIS